VRKAKVAAYYAQSAIAGLQCVCVCVCLNRKLYKAEEESALARYLALAAGGAIMVYATSLLACLVEDRSLVVQ